MIIILLLIALVILVLLIDWIPQFTTWQSRIKIGRVTDTKQWQAAVTQKSLHWLKKTPTIKLTDNSRLIIIDILRGNYKRESIQHWQEAALVLGLTAQYAQTKRENIKQQIDVYVNRKIKPDGHWVHPITESDGVILGYAFIQTPWLNHQQLKPAYDRLWQLIQELKGEHATVTYKRHTQKFRYVDTIGFICPFLIEYGQKFQVPEAVDLAIAQLEEFNAYGMYPNQFIPCHTYATKTKLPVGLFGWGRGLGWYAIGLIDAWKALDPLHPKKQAMTQWVEQFVRMAMQFQRENGSWGWLVMSENAQADSSATATLTWFLMNASAISSLEIECKQSTEKAIRYLMKVTRRDGAIDFSQGDTKGIGIHSQEFDILPFTQGFALRCVSHS
ncbi:glycoside hydrolase family 88 protein [Flavobacterium lacus]|uniref:Unsaturated rhamnogalacturonyl hydrolase n=1 Tax=Flavobacterium lacus TaxID=1353778 RepID=A0A328WXY0_9FLAO|nr:glycoside hydrolase family 88 protein [Flavobacterium lacus]RAR51141.1 unsaturated rhamnogalacturonyl hydrolase [Flavobacterium lacus]